jgi:hypothetical protein
VGAAGPLFDVEIRNETIVDIVGIAVRLVEQINKVAASIPVQVIAK